MLDQVDSERGTGCTSWRIYSRKVSGRNVDLCLGMISLYMCLRFSGVLKPVIDSEYKWTEAKAAFERLKSNRATGKVIVLVDPIQ